VRSPQKTTVVTGLKSGTNVTIVSRTVVPGRVVSSMKLTNPVMLKTVVLETKSLGSGLPHSQAGR